MVSIVDLLNRIRWDEAFGRGAFVIAYEDHLLEQYVNVPFEEIIFEEGDHFAFQLKNEKGELVTIPFHRVREVRKNGETIWKRTVHGS